MNQPSNEAMTLKVIAHIHTAFPTKFGIPRQSGLVDSLWGEIVFTPEYRSPDAVRGLEDFSHIWLVWQFSGAVRDSWSPTVRPPRLGGNTRMGVFATRSPFRPNPLGLSSVKLEAIEIRPEVGPVLIVRGADLMDGTPIYDIKPYIPYADCHPDAAAAGRRGAGLPAGNIRLSAQWPAASLRWPGRPPTGGCRSAAGRAWFFPAVPLSSALTSGRRRKSRGPAEAASAPAARRGCPPR